MATQIKTKVKRRIPKDVIDIKDIVLVRCGTARPTLYNYNTGKVIGKLPEATLNRLVSYINEKEHYWTAVVTNIVQCEDSLYLEGINTQITSGDDKLLITDFNDVINELYPTYIADRVKEHPGLVTGIIAQPVVMFPRYVDVDIDKIQKIHENMGLFNKDTMMVA